MSPERRRRAVQEVRRRLGPAHVSQRRACRVLCQARSTQRYQPRPDQGSRRLLAEMRRLAGRHPRFGVLRIHRELVADGWKVNRKRVHRLWRQEQMQIPGKQHRRRRLTLGGSQNSCVRQRAVRRNHVWSYDFVADRTEDGRALKLFVVIDEFTRECLALEVGRCFKSADVIKVLCYLFAVRGCRSTSAAITGRSSLLTACAAGYPRPASTRCLLPRAVPGKTAMLNRSTES